MKKNIILLLLIALVIAQFFKPKKNISEQQTNLNNIPENILKDLKIACYDCHSNQTNYPWYSNVQPVAWWLNKHIVNGKKHLNFDKKLTRKNFEEIVEVLEENEMPLFSYTIIHKEAKLNDLQKKGIMDWAEQANSIRTKQGMILDDNFEEDDHHQ
jgi:hypothetical protein